MSASFLEKKLMVNKPLPGVYRICIRDKAGIPPRLYDWVYVSDSRVGAFVYLGKTKYRIINRSGVAPTGELIVVKVIIEDVNFFQD